MVKLLTGLPQVSCLGKKLSAFWGSWVAEWVVGLLYSRININIQTRDMSMATTSDMMLKQIYIVSTSKEMFSAKNKVAQRS
jgi:hypothetical protein